MTKILVIADLHFQDNSEIGFFNLFIEKIDKLLQQRKYDYCVQLGDIHHKFKVDSRATQTLICNLFTTIVRFCPLYVLVGNHDMDDSQQFLTENHTFIPFKKWPKVTIVDTPVRVRLGDITAIFCPYVPKGRLVEALDTLSYKDADVVFCHQEMYGCKMGAITSIDGDHWSDDYPMIISGHIHNKHMVGKNIIYPGMPYDLGWDESEKRYVLEMTCGETIKLNYILSTMPRKIIVRLDYEQAIKWTVPDENNYYKLKVCCTASQFKEFSSTRKDLKAKVKILHVSSDEKRIEQFLLEKKKAGGNGDYKTIFSNLVAKEDDHVGIIYKKVLG